MGGYAWVTLATNDSYSLGALVLAHSLKQVGTKQQLAVLITPGVTGPMRTKLNEVFNLVKEVNILDSRDETNLRLLKRPELGVTFTKLHCWRLTQFEKCVFLDADTLVLENCDELFDREEFSAAPDIGWPDCFNSGVFVYHPSNDTYDKLIQFAIEKGSFDGGDQGLLNLYFSDWAHKDISKHLPFIYNMSSTATYSYLPAFKQFGGNVKIIHFIGATKPWLQYFDTESKRVHPSDDVKHLQEILQRWWNIFCSMIHPNLSPDMTGIAGAFAKLTLGVPRTPEQAALDDHLRRQGWEVGNIDYLGRDSFDNIWSKICETLSSTTESAPKPEESSPAESTEKVTKEPTSVQPEKEVPAEPQKESTPETLETSISAPSSVEAITAPVTPCAVSEAVIAPTAALLTSEPENPPVSNLETAPLPRPVSTPASQSDTAKIAADDVLISPSSIPGPALATPVPEITPEKATDSVPVSTTPPSVVPIETQSHAVVPTSVSETTIAQPITPTPAFTETKTPTPKQESSIPSSPLIPAPTLVSKNTASETEAKTFTSESSTGVPIPISTTVTTAQLIPDPESTAPSDSLKSGEIPSSGPTAPSTVDLTSAALKDTVPLDVKPQTAITPQVTETPKESQSIACSLPSVGPNSPKESPACPVSKESPVCTLPPKDIAVCPLPSKDSPTCPLPPKEVPVSPPPSKEDPVCPLPKALAVAPSGKKSKESVTLPKALVTEPTPPATPSSPQPKQVQQVLSGEQATTDTVSEASATGPTPPPRKSSGGTKKVASKKK